MAASKTIASGKRRNEWIAARLRELNRSQKDLARALGVEPPRITEILRGDRRVQPAEWQPLANFLELPVPQVAAYLGIDLSGMESAPDSVTPAPRLPHSGKSTENLQSIRNAALEAPSTFATVRSRDLPIYGAAEGGGGVMILDSDPIEYGERPANLLGVRGAYGVYIVNDSMAPAYEQGDKVHVHPGRPLKPGRDALFIAETADGTRHATVKRLVKATDKAWKVQQFNPPKTFDLPRKTWQRAFRIVGSERAD
jgi:phage repressor protein C with HTH and peptisase S24 domain